MVHGFPEPSDVGFDTSHSCCSRCETISDRYKRCSLQNIIQHIDIYGRFKTSYVERFKKDGSSMSMITAACYRTLKGAKGSVEGLLEDKMSKFSVTTRVSSLHPGQDKRKRLKTLKKVLIR